MDAFEDNTFGVPESDPAAEFLAREQDAMAGLDEDLAIPASESVTQQENNGLAESSESFEMINNSEAQEAINDDEFPVGYRSAAIPPAEEPEKIRKWREDQKAMLENKDQEEEKKREELKMQAKKELEDWYKQHDETITKTKSSNRNAEKEFVAETDAIEPGTEWERIARLCDFNPKASKTSRDVSRMRSIILQLKQNPIQARS